MRFNHGGGFVVGVSKVGDRTKSVFAVIGGHRVQQDVAASHARFHFNHFFTLNVQVFGDDVNLLIVQAVTA